MMGTAIGGITKHFLNIFRNNEVRMKSTFTPMKKLRTENNPTPQD